MLAISIILIVWFAIWLFFAYQRHTMLQVITCILIENQEEGDEDA